MELREITTFLQIAQLRSFSKAAQSLGYTQAAVTVQIRHLEEELDTRLFDRIGRQITLTSDGEIFFQHAQAIMQEIYSAKESVMENAELTAPLKIGTIESLCAWTFPSLLAEYHRRFPKVSISITLDSPNTLLDALNKNTLDLVYLMDRKIDDYRWIKLLESPEDIVFVANASNPIIHVSPLTLERVVQEPLLLTEKGASYRAVLEEHLAESHIQLRPFVEVGNTEFIVNHLLYGDGVSFLPCYSIKDKVESGELRVLTVEDYPPLYVWKQLLRHKDKWVTREMQAFINLVTEFS